MTDNDGRKQRNCSSFSSWTCLLFVFHTCCLFDVGQGVIQCVCTTFECQRDGRTTCEAENFCYVQVIPASFSDKTTTTRPTTGTGNGDVVRGCIDERTPLLCENRRPLTYSGAWPVLHCCRLNWCNRNVEPTLPAWADDIEDPRRASPPNHLKPNGPTSRPQDDSPAVPIGDNYEDIWYYEDDEPSADKPSQADSSDIARDSRRNGAGRRRPTQQSLTAGDKQQATLNPLYVAVPAACACVVLAFVIFAILLVKYRRDRLAALKSPESAPHRTMLLQQSDERQRVEEVPALCLVCGKTTTGEISAVPQPVF